MSPRAVRPGGNVGGDAAKNRFGSETRAHGQSVKREGGRRIGCWNQSIRAAVAASHSRGPAFTLRRPSPLFGRMTRKSACSTGNRCGLALDVSHAAIRGLRFSGSRRVRSALRDDRLVSLAKLRGVIVGSQPEDRPPTTGRRTL